MVGATSGIGCATAMAFAEAGANVVVAGRREHEGAEAVREIEAAGGEATFVRTDVTSEEQVAALMDAAVTTYGGLDRAFNNAGCESNLGVAAGSVALPRLEREHRLWRAARPPWRCLGAPVGYHREMRQSALP